MESLTPHLHAFYGASLSQAERESIHAHLLKYLVSDDCVAAADVFVSQCSGTLTSASPDVERRGVDALLLHYSLHAIETRVRTGYERMEQGVRKQLLVHLVEFTVAAFSWNMHTSAGSAGQPSEAGSLAVPSHVIMKAARSAAELGKREWVSDPANEFPHVVLGLVNQNGHSSTSMQRIFGGMVILTILLDEALDTSRADTRAADRAVLCKRISGISDTIVAALEMGLRISGPGLPSTVPAAAARTVGSLIRVSPSVAGMAVNVLRRRTAGPSSDLVGAEALGVLAELYGEAKIPLPDPWRNVLEHLASVLNPVAMRETAGGNSEFVALYRKRLTSYAEAVIVRCITSESESRELEAALNGLMGATMRWASENPEAFPNALDTWVAILEALEDAEVEPNRLVTMAYQALAKLCVDKCFFASNPTVLRQLEMEDDVDDDENSWEDHEMLAEIASRPAALASMLIASGIPGSGCVGRRSADAGEAAGEIDAVSRAVFCSKCVETLVAISRIFPSTACQAADVACKIIAGPLTSTGGNAVTETMFDKEVAAYLAYSVAPVLPSEASVTRTLAIAVANLFGQSPHVANAGAESVVVESWHWKSGLDVSLLRSATALATVYTSQGWVEGQNFATAFVHASRNFLQPRSQAPPASQLAAAVFLLTVGDVSRRSIFSEEPPIPPALIRQATYPAVASLGVVGAGRWGLSATIERTSDEVKERDSASTEASRRAKIVALQQCCGLVFEDFMAACSCETPPSNSEFVSTLSRGALLVRSLIASLYDEGAGSKVLVWEAVGRQLCSKMVNGLSLVSRIASGAEFERMGEEYCESVQKCIGYTVGTMGCCLRVFRSQVRDEAPGLAGDVISTVFPVAKRRNVPNLARALLVVLRDQLGDGDQKEKENLVAPAIELASQSLGGDPDVAVAAVGVLTECLSRFWQVFFPGDVALSTTPGHSSDARTANESIQKLFLSAFGAIISAVRHVNSTVSREGMLALERLEAQRRLYSRKLAFQDVNGPSVTISACIGAMWAAPLLVEESCAVVWGVGRTDWNLFYGENGSLLNAIRSVGACSADQTGRLLLGFGQPTDKPSFNRALVALVNDLRYTASLNEGPSM